MIDLLQNQKKQSIQSSTESVVCLRESQLYPNLKITINTH